MSNQRYDVYLPNFKISLKYQGKYYFHGVSIFRGEEKLKDTQLRDNKKKRILEIDGVHLIYVLSNYNINNIVNEIAQKAGIQNNNDIP